MSDAEHKYAVGKRLERVSWGVGGKTDVLYAATILEARENEPRWLLGHEHNEGRVWWSTYELDKYFRPAPSPSTIDVARAASMVAAPGMIATIRERVEEMRAREAAQERALAEVESESAPDEPRFRARIVVEDGEPHEQIEAFRTISAAIGRGAKAGRGCIGSTPYSFELTTLEGPSQNPPCSDGGDAKTAANHARASLGRIAYDAYGNARGWIAFNGQPIPQWEERPNLHEAWEAVALAVLGAASRRAAAVDLAAFRARLAAWPRCATAEFDEIAFGKEIEQLADALEYVRETLDIRTAAWNGLRSMLDEAKMEIVSLRRERDADRAAFKAALAERDGDVAHLNAEVAKYEAATVADDPVRYAKRTARTLRGIDDALQLAGRPYGSIEQGGVAAIEGLTSALALIERMRPVVEAARAAERHITDLEESRPINSSALIDLRAALEMLDGGAQ